MEATAALGVASAAVQFFDFSYKIVHSAYKMYKDGSEMTTDGVYIDTYVRNLEASMADLQAQNVHLVDADLRNLVSSCQTLGRDIVGMVRRSSRPTTSKVKRWFKSLGHAMKYAWNKEEIEDKLKRLDQLKNMLSSRFTDEQLKQARVQNENNYKAAAGERSRNQTKTMRSLGAIFVLLVAVGLTLFTPLNSLSQAWNRNQSTQQQKTILDWLGPLSMSHTHRNILSLRSPGTGTWLIEDESYKSWAKTPKNQAIWLRGIPGAGKTVLTSIVVENLLHHNQSDDTAVSFVYCDYNDAAQQTSERILSTILAAIIRHRPLSEQLVDFYNEHDKIGVQPTLTELERVRRVEATRLSSVFVIVDAIDEMKDDIREALLNVLFNLAPYLNIMLVSRPSIDISRQFLRIKTIEANAKDQDIHRYAEYRLMPNKRSQLAAVLEGRSDLRKHAVESVVDQSQGMFRLAQLHLDLLSDMPNARAFRRTLLDLPLGLDAAHNETINRILNQSDVARETAISALKWLTNVRRPITLLELQYALAVESDAEVFDPEGLVDEEYILSVCKGLVTVADEPHVHVIHDLYGQYGDQGTMVRMVYLSHYTVLEYLKTDNRFHGPATEEQLALACLTHLLFQVNDTRNNGSEDASAQNKNPFHAYAAEFWGVHARGEPEAVLGPRAFQFVGDYKKTGYVRSALASSSMAPVTECGHDRPLCHLVAFGLHLTIQRAPESLFRFELANEYFFSRALRKASARGYTDIVQFLLDRAKISDFSVGTLGRALHSASRNGHLEIVKKLIHAGADVNGSYLTPWIAAEDSVPLCVACEHGHADIVEFLLGHTAVSKWYDCSGLPLELAARKAQLDVAKTLISHGADVKFGSVWQGSPLLSAAMAGHVDMMKLLLENGADARATVQVRPLMALTCGERVVGKKYSDMQLAKVSALHGAAYCGYAEAVRLLIAHDSDVESDCYRKMTPLQIAANGHRSVVEILLDHGASIDGSPDAYLTPLQTAVFHGNIVIIKLLLRRGASPDAPPGKSALLTAIRQGDEDAIKLLLDFGATPSAGSLRTAALGEHASLEWILYKEAKWQLKLRWGLYRPVLLMQIWARHVKSRFDTFFGLQKYPGLPAP